MAGDKIKQEEVADLVEILQSSLDKWDAAGVYYITSVGQDNSLLTKQVGKRLEMA